MTYKELQDEVFAMLQDRGDLTTAILKDYVNRAYRQLAMSFRFYELEQTDTSTATVADTATVSVPTGCRETITIRDTTNKYTLDPKSIEWYEEQDTSTDVTGPPEYYVRYGSNYLLWPTPDGAYSLRIRYTKLPTDLSADGDEPVYPEEWHQIIQFLAASMLCFRYGLDTKGMNLKNEALGLIQVMQEDPVMDRRNKNLTVNMFKTRKQKHRRDYAERP